MYCINFLDYLITSYRSVRLYAYDGTLIEKLEEHEGPAFAIRLGNEGVVLTAAEDGTVRVWKGFIISIFIVFIHG